MIYLPYARVSPRGSEWREKEIESSIPAQLAELERWVRAHDAAGELLPPVTDEFKSAGEDSLDARPGMCRILSDLETGNGGWDTLITIDMDRVTRSMYDASTLLRALGNANRGLVALRQAWDYSTPMGRLMLLQTVAFSEYFLASISAKTRDKMMHIARAGQWPAGRCPVGYKRRGPHDNVLVPDDRDAERVRRAYELYADGVSTLEISRTTGLHHKTLANRILRNPIYAGRMKYGDYEGPGAHAPLVPLDLWRRVQEMLPGRTTGPRPAAQTYDYLLTGLVRCYCGMACRPYSAKNRHGTRYHYYRCHNPDHPRRAIRADTLETAVVSSLLNLTIDDTQIRLACDLIRQQRDAARTASAPELATITAAITEAETERNGIDNAFIAGIVTPQNSEYWNEKLSTVRTELARLTTRRDDLRALLDTSLDVYNDAATLTAEIASRTSALRADPTNRTLMRAAITTHVERVTHVGDDQFEVHTYWSGLGQPSRLASPRGVEPLFSG